MVTNHIGSSSDYYATVTLGSNANSDLSRVLDMLISYIKTVDEYISNDDDYKTFLQISKDYIDLRLIGRCLK